MNTKGVVPVWELPDRMRRALRHSGVTRPEMAEHLRVSLNTINNWLNGHSRIRYESLALWADKTSVNLDWLMDDDWRPPESDEDDPEIPQSPDSP